MSIDLTGVRIIGHGPSSKGIRIETSEGKEILGISAIQITILPNALIELTLSVAGANLIDLQDLEGSVDIDEQDLVKELRRRGYVVKIDDSDIERELHQTDEQDQNTASGIPAG